MKNVMIISVGSDRYDDEGNDTYNNSEVKHYAKESGLKIKEDLDLSFISSYIL